MKTKKGKRGEIVATLPSPPLFFLIRGFTSRSSHLSAERLEVVYLRSVIPVSFSMSFLKFSATKMTRIARRWAWLKVCFTQIGNNLIMNLNSLNFKLISIYVRIC